MKLLRTQIRRWLLVVFLLPYSLNAEDALRVNGSTTVNPVVTEAAEILKKERGLKIQIDTQGGSSGGINALGKGRVDIAMSSRPLSGTDHGKYSNVKLLPTKIGEDAVALIVSKDVWNGGIRSLSREQVQKIYERKISNWKDLGGPDRRIAFFNKEPGRGTWEVFATWLYGNADKAPSVAHPEVGANEEARNKVAGSRGALSQLSASWADGKTVFALGIKGDNGEVTLPTAEHIAAHDYPLSRSLWVISNGPPSGTAKILIDFILSERGQKLVHKNGYLSLADLKK
ncbi:phosphate ABC transporter substrate-binding protein (plasmid) [Verrucomicrobiaceae bacterium 227]